MGYTVEPRFYVSSGKVSFFSVLAGLAFLVGVPIFLGPIYAYCLVYNPSLYLGVALPILLAAVCAGGPAWVLQRLGMRSQIVGILFALAIAVATYFVSWPVWLYATLSRGGAELNFYEPFFPPSFIEFIGFIYDNGAWTIGRGTATPVSGIALAVVWLVEFLIIAATAPAIGLSVFATGVFCENCEHWCVRSRETLFFDPSMLPTLANALRVGNLEPLETAPRGHDPNRSPSVVVQRCPSCRQTNALTLFDNRATVQDGKETVEHLPVVENLLIPPEAVDWFERLAASAGPIVPMQQPSASEQATPASYGGGPPPNQGGAA